MPEPEQKHWRAVRHRSIALLSSYKSADSYAKKHRQKIHLTPQLKIPI